MFGDSPEKVAKDALSFLDKFKEVQKRSKVLRKNVSQKLKKVRAEYDSMVALATRQYDTKRRVIDSDMAKLDEAERVATKVLSFFEN